MTTTHTTAYVDHTLIGTPEHVANVIRNHYTAGTLVSMGAPRPVSATDPRIRIRIRLRDTNPSPASDRRPATRPAPAPAPRVRPTAGARPAPYRPAPPPPVASLSEHITRTAARPRTRTRIRRLAVVASTVVAALTGLTFTAGYILSRLTADALTNAAATIGGFLTITAILAALLSGGSRSGKRHCPGCD